MRTFYIFYINNEFKVLARSNPYNLFKTMETIYYLDKHDLSVGANLFEQVAIPFDREKLNQFIYKNHEDNDFYTKNRNTHKIYNKYRDENTVIETHLAYLSLKTNVNKKEVFKKVHINDNMFVCDFENKDYFWLDKVINKVV
ncbi:MAG: sporulation inhibitor of replication protein SirA [bacterium]